MRDRLTGLGWSEIAIIDDDLGRSAAGSVTRAGFERMVAEVRLGKVGAVAAREVSRFARNSRDWQQLIEMCRVVDTVLVDGETIYAPRQGYDRLLLGLKGSLNEYELDLLRQRSLSARYEKGKKRIVRTMIREVIADIDTEAGAIVLLIHWMGGVHTELRLPRRRRGQRSSTSSDIVAAVRHLVLIANDDLIAGLLNRNKLTPGHGNRWTRERVTSLRSSSQDPGPSPCR